MRIFISVCWLVLAGTLLPVVLCAQYRAQARLDSTSISVGDQVQLQVEVVLPNGVVLQKIRVDTLGTVSGLERLKTSVPISEVSTTTTTYTQAILLTAFDTGYFRLPPIPVEVEAGNERTQVFTNDLALRVRSILTDSTQLQPIKGIIQEPLHIKDFWPLGVVLILLVGGYLLYRYLRRPKAMHKQEVIQEVQRPAHEIALEKLGVLQASSYLSQGAYKTYQTELTYILREYLFLRFGYNALEATSEEIEVELRAWDISSEWKATLVQVLKRADLVKFAKGSLPLEAHTGALERVREFVSETGDNGVPVTPP